MIPDRIMRKIERCMALSQSSNAHEAGIALRQAQQLMQRYGLNEQDITLASVTDHMATAQAGKVPPRYLNALATLVMKAFGAQAIYLATPQIRGTQIRWLGQWQFLGTDGASQVAAYAYEVLQRQLIRDRKAYQSGLSKRIKRATRVRRGDAYAEAWVAGARESIVPVELSPAATEALEAYAERQHGELCSLSSRQRGQLRHHDYQAVHQGYDAGRQVRLHDAIETPEREALGHG
ncbi:DUF2786 domain-containing protein [Halomonas elongata]|uniref:DUF2786 domain-containing protein n=1 Tax=Halomonas elongata TaxID=2746 RepID=UPI0023B0062E|nr:DUF2786 domain-containing protein [Halomonas elongata]